MTAWTVQCHYAAYYARTETVEAETLEDACARAVAQANASDLWTALDHHCGPTFVAAVAEGAGADPWGPDALPVPGRCTEAGEPPLVVVTGPAPAGGVRVEQGRARIRFVREAGAFTADLYDRPAPHHGQPLVCVVRRADGAPHVTVTGGKVRVRYYEEEGAAPARCDAAPPPEPAG